MLIPRVFHQIWVGPDPFPDEFTQYQQTWVSHHPGWELRFWTEESLPDRLRRREVYERLRSPVERCDILRFEVLWRWGGVYVDTDFECLRSIEPLIGDVDFFTAYIERDRVNGAMIGAVPAHPLIDDALTEMQPRKFFGYDKEAAGPLFFDRIVSRYPEATIFERELFYGKIENPREVAYAIHHPAAAWKDAKVYQYEAAKWRASVEKAWRKTEEWRSRGKRAEAELARMKAERPAVTAPADDRVLPALRKRCVPQVGGRFARPIGFAAWIALALSLAALGGFDGLQRLLTDHNNFGDSDYLAMAAAWLGLAAWAASRGWAALPSRRGGVRRTWFVAALLLAALPYSAMFESDLGYLINACLVLFALVGVLTRLRNGRHKRSGAEGCRDTPHDDDEMSGSPKRIAPGPETVEVREPRSAPTVAMSASRSFWWAMGSLPLIIVGALGPWAQVVKSRIDGPQDEVVLSLALIAAVVLIAFAGSRHHWLALVPLVAGILAAVLTGSDIQDVGGISPHVNERLATVDWGLYLAALGSMSLVLASALMVAESRGRLVPSLFRVRVAAAPAYERFAGAMHAFEEILLDQRPVPDAHYDREYFVAGWREGENRYDLETRRRIEDRNPRLIKEVFAPRRVLDVGCGPGLLMALLAELGVEADGVDLSPSARQLAPSAERERIAIAPASELPHGDAMFDLVVCREVLEHLTILQIRRTVAELCRVSSRFVYVTTRFHPEPATLLDVTTQFDVDPTHITLLAKDFVRCLFALEGFRRRADLERRLDWAGKNRVLVYERASARLGCH